MARSSVSLWVRDVAFVPNGRRRLRAPRPSSLHLHKLEQIELCKREAIEQIGGMSNREFLVLGAALYAGEGSKTYGGVKFANCDPRMIFLFVVWLRRFFEIEESRLRVALYLHQGLDLCAATEFWSRLTEIPVTQFTKPYRAVADQTIRRTKHVMGCPSVVYGSTTVFRRVMGPVEAVLSPTAFPG